MKNKKIGKYKSIQLKSALVVVIALMLGTGVYFAVNSISEYFVEKYYLTVEREDSLVNSYLEDFQAYVTRFEVNSDDNDAIQKWCHDKKNVYFMLFDNENLKKIIDGSNIYEYEESEATDNSGYELHPIIFNDREYNVSLIEYGDGAVYNAIHIISLAVAFLCVFMIILLYLLRLIRRIKNITDETKKVSVDVNYSVSADKNDEIGDLYLHIENMRKDIILHYEKQKETLEANRQLITNMSHDIRTPLTAIIGFNEMMQKQGVTEEEMKQYAELSLQKANQLKNMSDKLFKYFLVYDKDRIETNIESVSMSLLLNQVVAEKAHFLKQDGFSIELDESGVEEALLQLDTILINRVFDNIFSNILKYADRRAVIKISTSIAEGAYRIVVSNAISPIRDNSVSTNIGVKSCEKVMEAMNGSFEGYEDNGIYYSVINIPL